MLKRLWLKPEMDLEKVKRGLHEENAGRTEEGEKDH